MKVRKTIKKIAALGIGISMLGTTVLGAMAADLSDYPNPLFIKNGGFEGVIVLGDDAISSDTLGAIDIATGLQYSGASSEVSISDGVRISKSGNELNINESLGDVETSLDESDMPTILADGVYDENEGNNDNDERYTQEIAFTAGAGNGQLIVKQDDDDAPEGGLYLFFDDGNDNTMYNYTLEFDDKIEYDNTSETTAEDDFETSKITIQGNLYTVTDIKLSGGKLDKITMQAGDTTVWLEQGVPITRIVGGEEHEVELINVNENEDKCGVTIDGQLTWIDVGSSDEIAGVEVGATEAITVHSEAKDTDVCEVNLGATEVVLENDDEVEINGKEIDDSDVEFVESTAGELTDIKISYIPEDEIYLAPGESVADPVLGNFEISFAGTTEEYEEIDLDVSGDDLTLTFNNIDGKEIELPFYCNGSCEVTDDEVIFGSGDDEDDRYYLKGDVCTGSSDVTDCEGARFMVEQGDELHVIEIEDIDLNDNETTLSDVTYGGSKTTKDKIENASNSFKLPAGGSSTKLTISTANDTVAFDGDASNDDIVAVDGQFETENEMYISLHNLTNGIVTSGDALTIAFDEVDGEIDGSTDGPDDSRDAFNFTVTIDTSDEELNIGSPSYTGAFSSGVDESEDNDNDQIYYTDFGTKIVHDDDDKRSAKVWFSNEELYANVFVSPVGANIVSTGQGATQKIEVGTAKLASEVASLEAQNSIIVGGPCANAAAAEFLGVTMATCSEGAPEENTAVIKLKEMGDYVAMLVNGYEAIDTRRASRVLGNYVDYASELAGDEVVVTGTDFTNIVVSSAE